MGNSGWTMSDWSRTRSGVSRHQRANPSAMDGATERLLPRQRSDGTSAARLICAWGLLFLLVAAVLAFGAVQPWSELAFEIGVTAVFLVWAFEQARSRRLALTPAGLYAPALGFFLVVATQIVFHRSAYQYVSESTAFLLAAYGIVLLIATECIRGESLRRRISLALTGFGACYAMFAIAQNLTDPRKLYWTIDPTEFAHTYGSYVNRNHYAGLMEMLAPIPLVLAMGHLLRGGKKALAGVAFLLMAGSIFLATSRGGMFAFAVEALLFGVLLLRNPRHKKILPAFAVMLLLVVAFLAYTSTGQVGDRLHDASDSHRLAMSRDALKLWTERPILGWGLGTFATVDPHVRSFATDLLVNAAHNDYAQTLAETGIAGFSFVLWFIVVLGRKGAQNSRDWDRDWGCALSLAALLGCCGMLVHSFVDFNLQIPANAAFFFFLAAIAAAPATAPTHERL